MRDGQSILVLHLLVSGAYVEMTYHTHARSAMSIGSPLGTSELPLSPSPIQRVGRVQRKAGCGRNR